MINERVSKPLESRKVEMLATEAIQRIKTVLNPNLLHYEQLLIRMNMIVGRGNGAFLIKIASNELVMGNLKSNPWLLVHLGAYGTSIFDDQAILENVIFNSNQQAEADSESYEAVKHRMETNPDRSQEETSAGIYWEVLEPQVRGAIIKLNKKGYSTFESGFRDKAKGSQYIGCWKGADAEAFHITEEIREELKARDIDIVVDTTPTDRDYLFLIPENPRLSLAEWKEIWDMVAEALPAKG